MPSSQITGFIGLVVLLVVLFLELGVHWIARAIGWTLSRSQTSRHIHWWISRIGYAVLGLIILGAATYGYRHEPETAALLWEIAGVAILASEVGLGQKHEEIDPEQQELTNKIRMYLSGDTSGLLMAIQLDVATAGTKLDDLKLLLPAPPTILDDWRLACEAALRAPRGGDLLGSVLYWREFTSRDVRRWRRYRLFAGAFMVLGALSSHALFSEALQEPQLEVSNQIFDIGPFCIASTALSRDAQRLAETRTQSVSRCTDEDLHKLRVSLDRAVAAMSADASSIAQVFVVGGSDTQPLRRGARRVYESNVGLAYQRAIAVQRELEPHLRQSVDPAAWSVTGGGPADLLSVSRSARAADRHVKVVLLKIHLDSHNRRAALSHSSPQ